MHSSAHIETLCRRLEALRLSRNISQVDLAHEAGVSRSTMTRIADGKPISLDSFVRVMLALDLEDNLFALLPDPSIQPVTQVRLGKPSRQRAGRKQEDSAAPWTWGDDTP